MHKKSKSGERHGNPSSKLKRLVCNQFELKDCSVMDAPCGFGRNSIYLAQLGANVVAVDVDHDCLDYIESTGQDGIVTVEADLLRGWTFKHSEFSCIVNIHWVQLSLFENFAHSLSSGGLLFFESYENRGGNYLELPRRGQVLRKLKKFFDVLHYEESPAGPTGWDAVTACALARKRDD
jgi:2-polyprenyl-3-methyl-5-hydroxy-6-metoxy-1,4-benzoquinol methylase